MQVGDQVCDEKGRGRVDVGSEAPGKRNVALEEEEGRSYAPDEEVKRREAPAEGKRSYAQAEGKVSYAQKEEQRSFAPLEVKRSYDPVNEMGSYALLEEKGTEAPGRMYSPRTVMSCSSSWSTETMAWATCTRRSRETPRRPGSLQTARWSTPAGSAMQWSTPERALSICTVPGTALTRLR